ncbi:MAG: periplasmic heavy metal sensor [Alphaproteobacteria bacterium]|nr:periplasmic heavy metal sensor [Alphaproteobacteria bacterium]
MSDTPRAPRRSRVWLIVSLCLNLFLIGLIVAGLVVARNRMIASAVRGDDSLPPEVMLQLLPPTGAVKMCNVMSANVAAFVRLGRDLVDARRNIFKAFRAEPFDRGAFKTALGQATAAQVALVQLRQSVALEIAEKLDPAERQELSRKLVRRFFRGARGERTDHPTVRELCAAAGAASAQPPR